MGSFIHLLYNFVILKHLGNKFEFLRELMGHSFYCYALYKKLILMYGQEIPWRCLDVVPWRSFLC